MADWQKMLDDIVARSEPGVYPLRGLYAAALFDPQKPDEPAIWEDVGLKGTETEALERAREIKRKGVEAKLNLRNAYFLPDVRVRDV